MSRLRLFRLTIGIVLLVGMRQVSFSRGPFVPYVPPTLPQAARGDFDGDGRSDLALIQDGDTGRQVFVQLSGSLTVTSLGKNVVSLIVSDIDHDGDLDLIAVTSSSQVVAWVNDGRGGFTPKPTARSSTVSADSAVADASPDEPIALGAPVPLVIPCTRHSTAVCLSVRHPRSVPFAFDLGVLSQLRLRAPPLALTLT